MLPASSSHLTPEAAWQCIPARDQLTWERRARVGWLRRSHWDEDAHLARMGCVLRLVRGGVG